MRYNIINKSKVIGRNVIKKMWRSIQGKKYEPGVDKRPLRKITNLTDGKYNINNMEKRSFLKPKKK